MDSPDYPEYPDPAETADVQAEYDEEAALLEASLNRVDEYGPYGSSVYTENEREVDPAYDEALAQYEADLASYNAGNLTPSDTLSAGDTLYGETLVENNGQLGYWSGDTGGNWRPVSTGATYSESGGEAPVSPNIEDYYTDYPSYSRTTTLSPTEQEIYDAQSDITLGSLDLGGTYLDEIAGQPSLDLGQFDLPDIPTLDDYAYEEVRNALYTDIAEQDTYDQERLNTQLANQGIPLGSEAYAWEQDIYNEGLNDLYLQSALYAGDEQTRQYGLALDEYNAELGQYDIGLQNYLTEYYSPYNELSSLLGYSAGVTTPTYSSVPVTSVNAPDYTGLTNAAYNADYNEASADAAANSALWGDLFSLAGTAATGAMFLSSKDAKERVAGEGDIFSDDVLGRIEGIPVERWRYKGDDQEHIGPYAEDFADTMGVGNDKGIHGSDVLGTSLLAIKELTKRVKELESRNA